MTSWSGDLQSIVAPKRPTMSPDIWKQLTLPAPVAQRVSMGYAVEAWECSMHEIQVFSAVEVAEEADGKSIGPEFHLSVSKWNRRRCSRAEAQWVLAQFDLLDATEDNHVPHGFVRNFWRPVADGLSGQQCACVDTEQAIREDKGEFVWRAV
jgi:hypothetical protein